MFFRVGSSLALVAGFAIAGFAFPGIHFGHGKRAHFIRPIEQSVPAAGIEQVVIQNLDGPITVTTSDTNQIKVDVLIHGGGLDQTFAQTLANQVNFDIKADGTQFRVIGHYPTQQFHSYGYPYMKHILFFHGTDSNTYQGQRIYIRAIKSDKAVELWSEVRVTMPSRMGLVIRSIYGDVRLQGGGPASSADLDAFTDVGDYNIFNPRWKKAKIQTDYGTVKFRDGFGALTEARVKVGNVGDCDLFLPPGSTGTVYATKDFGFLHNNFTNAKFSTTVDGEHEMVLGDGHGTTMHIDLNFGSLKLDTAP